jgi:hypothetical protein
VTSTNSSAPKLDSVPGDVPALTVGFPGTLSDAQRRSCLGIISFIDQLYLSFFSILPFQLEFFISKNEKEM